MAAKCPGAGSEEARFSALYHRKTGAIYENIDQTLLLLSNRIDKNVFVLSRMSKKGLGRLTLALILRATFRATFASDL